jgi:hypothetical protein
VEKWINCLYKSKVAKQSVSERFAIIIAMIGNEQMLVSEMEASLVPRIRLKMLAMVNKCGSTFTCKVHNDNSDVDRDGEGKKDELKKYVRQGLHISKLQ